MAIRVLAGGGGGLLIGEVLHALAGLEVVLHPEGLAFLIDPLEGVGAVAILVAGGLRGAAVTHQVGDLVCGFRVAGPEVPLHIGIAQAIGAQALLGVDEVWELNAIADEEDRGVIAHDVEVAFFGVETQGKAVHIAPGIRGALLAGHGGKAAHHRGDGALLEDLGLGIGRDIFRDVQLTKGAVALSVRRALRHALAVEVRELFNEVDIIERHWALLAGGHRGIFGRHRLARGAGGISLASGALALIQDVISGKFTHFCLLAIRGQFFPVWQNFARLSGLAKESKGCW